MNHENNCLIIAGEKSGEEHCLSFLPALQKNNPDLNFWGVGGDQLESAGVELLYHLNDFSSWGFSEVITKIPFYFNALKRITEESVSRNCKMAILVDFQDFNMRLAKKLTSKGVSVFYYVAPQAWAWKSWRAKVLGQSVHTLFTILPFEKEWFTQRGVKQVIGVENPVYTHFAKYLGQKTESTNRTITLLPGSRSFEVLNLLPIFVRVVKKLQEKYDFSVKVVCSSSVKSELFQGIADFEQVSDDQLAQTLLETDIAIAASGTVTLTAALFGIPTIVAYKSSYFNEYIFNTFLSYNGPISLPNIVLQNRLLPELIQDDANEYNILKTLIGWLEYNDDYNMIKEELKRIPNLLKGDGINVGEFLAKNSKEIYD